MDETEEITIKLPDLELYKAIGWLDQGGIFHEFKEVTDGSQ
jgi:hypothetical protein